MGTHNKKQTITLLLQSLIQGFGTETYFLAALPCSSSSPHPTIHPARTKTNPPPSSRLNTQPFAGEITANTYALHYRNVIALTTQKTSPLPWHKYVVRPATTSARSNNRNNIPHTAPVPPAWVADPTRQTTPPLSRRSEPRRARSRICSTRSAIRSSLTCRPSAGS